MSPLEYKPEGDNVAKIEYTLPTLVENDKQLDDYLMYLKSIKGMGAITNHDLQTFYALMKIPQRFSKDNLKKLFTFMEQAASAEYFESTQDAADCVSLIETYRTEMDM